MYEEKTYEALLEEKLSLVDDKFDKRQGSPIYAALAPNSVEQARLYSHLAWLHNQMFGDTAERDGLTRIARDTRGLSPSAATYAVRKCVADAVLPLGLSVSLDILNYTITEAVDEAGSSGEYVYKAVCQESGEIGNKYSGEAIPNEFVEGLTAVRILDVLIPGEDEEDTEAFRKRWRDNFRSIAFGGNKTDYKEKINGIEGVGGVKTARARNASGEVQGGHVLAVIIASDFSVPSRSLVEKVQEIIDPVENAGEGDGLAPIDHTVHIQAVTGKVINVATTLTLDTGYSFEDIKSFVEGTVDKYFLSINKEWEEKGNESIVVRIAQIESAILKIIGVLDITGTMLNGEEKNVILDKYEIAVRGEISG
ncbi:MAG: baseplate J/gp47 family protein [Acetivibrio ethanolgignens]